MATLIELLGHLPLPKHTKLDWQARMVDRGYRKEIAKARRSKHRDAVRELEGLHQEELAMMREEIDAEYSTQLLRTARSLRVPIPSLVNEEGELMPDWERGNRLRLVNLSERGIAKVRDAIRTEQRWEQEQRAHWVVWLSAVTGILGALTGVLAILSRG